MATNGTRKYFNIDQNTSSEQISAALDNVERADKDDIDDVTYDSDTEVIAEKEITQTASTQDTSLTTPGSDLHVVPSDNQSKKKEKKTKTQ